jgi:putative inorganic carbon (HCO3(-)) transporter
VAIVANARRLLLALLALFPLLAWPALSHPFSTPKLFALVGTVILLTPAAWLARRERKQLAREHSPPPARDASPRSPPVVRESAGHAWSLGARQGASNLLAFCWIASWTWSALLGDFVSPDALLLAYATALVAILTTEIAPRPEQVAMSMVVGATAVAVVAVSQLVGLDPFALGGWIAPIEGASARLRVYSTLGNPNFVAALLAAAVPLTLGLFVASRRTLLLFAVGLQLLALVATGSRAGALGLMAAALCGAMVTPRDGRMRVRVLVAAAGCLVVVALIAIAMSTGRPLGETVGGRGYIIRIAAPHAFEAPIAGRGPGAFEFLYPTWERERTAPVDAGARNRFAGPQQHAHNDYLEALIERGMAGPVTIVAILATCFWNGWRRIRAAREAAAITVGTLAMMAAVAAIAAVDFPLARPAEATWWWCGVAIIALIERRDRG